MLLFRSEEHVDRWCRSWRVSRGETLSPLQTWRLAKVWYAADRRAADWRRPTAEETDALLAPLGLTGEFWELR